MKKTKFIDFSIFLYAILFVLYSFSGRILPIALFIGNTMNGIIYSFFAIVGCILILCDFFLTKRIVHTQYFGILCSFVLIMFVSSLINIDLGYIENIKTIIWTGIQVTIFYSLYLRISKEKMVYGMKWTFIGISIIWTAAIVVSLFQYILQDVYRYDITGVGFRIQGFYAGRLFGIFNDPNFAAVTSSYVIYMLIFIFANMKMKWYKVCLLWIAGILNFIYLFLSGSRTAISAFFFALFIYLFLHIKNKKIFTKHYLGKSILEACIIVCIVFAMGMTLKKVSVMLPEIYGEKWASEIGHVKQDKLLMKLLRGREDVILYWDLSPVNQSDSENKQNSDTIEVENTKNSSEVKIEEDESEVKVSDEKKPEDILERNDINKNNISNNRFEIWKEYLQGMKGRYLLGTSPRNMLSYLERTNRAEYVVERKYEIHNGYLSVLVGCGVIGCIPVLLFAFLMARRITMYCLQKQKIEEEFILLFSIIIVILVYVAFFTELFFVNNLTTVLFWVIVGSFWYWI